MRRYLPALLVFSSVLTLALAGYWLSLQSFRRDMQSQFADSARATSSILQHSLAEKLLLLESMHSLFAIFDGLPQPQFQRFVQPFADELGGVQSLQWIVPVRNADRLAFETAMQHSGAAGYMITERTAQGLVTRAGERELYFPLYPLGTQLAGAHEPGHDMGSEPLLQTPLQQAIRSGSMTLSQRVDLRQTSADRSSLAAFKPLYADNRLPTAAQDAVPQLRGLVLGVFQLDTIFDQVLAAMPQQHINYLLRDLKAPAGESELLRRTLTEDDNDEQQATYWQPENQHLRFRVADREWELVASPTTAFMQRRQSNTASFILSIGLLLACILGSYMVEQVRNSERIGATEAERHSLENQLFRSQKMEAIGRLVGGIAHDFSNLLTSIMGYAELALYERDAQRNEEYLTLIQQGGEKGRGLISKLLSFSRNEPAQQLPLELTPLVEHTLSMLKPVLPARIDLQFRSEAGLPRVSIDPTSLDQALVNLCINARDAIDQRGSIRISLELQQAEALSCTSCDAKFSGNFVALRVADSGSGIPQESLTRIFKPFYTTKEAGKGTGLGLSIIHNVVHGCRGHVVVSSQPGTGTQFQLLFPAVEKARREVLLKTG
jgi:signal transduction histidine kinase